MSEEEFFNRMINQISKVFDGRIATRMKNIYLKKDKQLNKQKEVIDKAIEYINEATNSDSYTILPSGKHTDISYCIVAFEDLLNILGDNK